MGPPSWQELCGGYRTPYDPRQAIHRLRDAPLDEETWTELWDELHHQGDVGEASYAAVPLLVEACWDAPRDWNVYALVATIEVRRQRTDNPALPSWVRPEYEAALSKLATLALADLERAADPLVIRSAMSIVALARGDRPLGALLAWTESSEIEEILDEVISWTTRYDQRR